MAKYSKYNKTRKTYYWKNRDKILAKRRKYIAENREEHNRKTRNWRRKRYREVLKILGDECARCGFDDWRALELHHRRGCPRLKNGKRDDWDYLRKDYDHSLLELLCGNCHNIETWGKAKDQYE